MSGRVSSSGCCGLNRNSTRLSAPSSFTGKQQGSVRRKSTLPNVPCPAKRMSLNAMGCRASLLNIRHASRGKPQERFLRTCVNSLWTCTLSWREIAEVCYIRSGRKPSHNSVKQVIASGPPPSLTARRYQPWHLIPDPAERKLAVIRLHSEGWSITFIAEYMQTSRPTIYATLQRWTEEGVRGLEEKSRARKGPRKVTLKVRNEIRKLQENPRLGEYRVHTALLREGIEVSPATCGRIMAANLQVYGLEQPKRQPRAKQEMPFRASHRHEYWSADIRYIEEHLLPDPRPVYVIT